LDFESFKRGVMISEEQICRLIHAKRLGSIRIKKEAVATRNLRAIFAATLKLANARGFKAMSLRELSRESGLSMGVLYSCFSSKDVLLELIQDQGRCMVMTVLDEHVARADSPPAKLAAAIRAHLFLSEVMQPWFFFSYMETRHLGKELQRKAIAGELATEQLFIDIIETGRRQGVFAAVNVALTAAVLKAMLQDWYLKRWKYARRKIGVESYARFVIDLMHAWVSRPAAGTEPEEPPARRRDAAVADPPRARRTMRRRRIPDAAKEPTCTPSIPR
jgi:AcrR family transcriptional regulator